MSSPASRRIRSLRGAKVRVDPWTPLEVIEEHERRPGGDLASWLTVFLAGSECPFTCVFCDLWRQTLDEPTPPGAVPHQLERATKQAGPPGDRDGIKLYNASNFFDPRAVPPTDHPAIQKRLAPFSQVAVECHPLLVDGRCLEFADGLAGRLQVGMGLETVHPRAAQKLNKQMGRGDFAAAAELLAGAGIGVRAFVLVGTPFIPPQEAVEWAVRSALWAVERGAEVVSLIPVRGGNGEMERLAAAGEFTPPTIGQLEAVMESCLAATEAVVLTDLWDLERFSRCPECGLRRTERLGRMNLSGRLEPSIECDRCS